MRAYWALFAARARSLFQYRAAAFAGIVTQWVFGYMMICVLAAFYGLDSASSQPMTYAQTVSYTWLGQAMLGMLPWNIDVETGDSVRSGAVAYDLARPLDLYTHWFARAIALRTAPTLLRAVPIFIIASLLPADIALRWPDLAGLAAWLSATLGALLLSCAVTLLMQSSLFWTVTGDGVTRIMPHIVTLLSGMIIPLPLMPNWLQPFLRVQPFAGLVSLPGQLFCGALPPDAVWGILALQAAWTVVFVLLGRLVVRRGLTKLTVAGG